MGGFIVSIALPGTAYIEVESEVTTLRFEKNPLA